MNLGDTETLHRGASGVDLFGFREMADRGFCLTS